MPGTYHKMEDGEGGRRHKHRHHSHHRHRHGDRDRERDSRHYQPSTDTSLEITSRHNFDAESTYKDSLYNPKDSLYGPAVKDSLYSGEEGGGHHHQRGYNSGSETRLTSPGRFSPRPPSRERHAENTFDAVTKGHHRRSQEDRIWQDPVSRGAESGQIRHTRKPQADPTNLRVYIEPGRPGSGLAAAAALVRGDVYTPEKISGAKVKVPPPVPQKPGKTYNKMGMEELWPGGWEEYTGSEEAQEQDSLDGHLVSSPAEHTIHASPEGGQGHSAQGKSRRYRRSTQENDLSSSESEGSPRDKQKVKQSKAQHQPQQSQQAKPSLKITMERAQSNFSQKSAVSKTSKSSKAGSARPQGTTPTKKPSLDLNPFSGILWDRRESFAQLWVTLSAMYGKILVLLMFAFCLIEVMDNKIQPLFFQNFFMMYLYCGSIIAIMCIYITVLLDNCPSVTNSRENLTNTGDPEVGSIGSLGTLRRAHISRNKVSRTSFYLRVGALVFGLGTLIFIGLEIAMHATMNNTDCINNIVIAHPILQALFTFLQMHFLFVNSTVIVERFGLFARFGFIHLVATNLALWIRIVIWESANEWIHHVYTESINNFSKDVIRVPDSPIAFGNRRSDNFFIDDRSLGDIGNYDFVNGPEASLALSSKLVGGCNTTMPISPDHIRQVISLYACFNDNTLGKLWTSSMPYLFPFIVEYSLIAAAVTYIMWQSVGDDKIKKMEGKKLDDDDSSKKRKGYWRVDCQSASKGLFLGLLCLVGGIIIIIIFFVMKDSEEFRGEMFWIYYGAEIVILTFAIIASCGAFVQIQKLSHSFNKPYKLDNLLSSITVFGSYIYALFGILSSMVTIDPFGDLDIPSVLVFIQCSLLLVQVSFQSMIISEASRRICTTRAQQQAKPGRQIITFMLFANITLWVLDTFMTHRDITQGVQTQFFGLLAWGIISRISLPLLIFYRFHSCVVLVEIWKNTYRTKESL